MYMDGWIDTPLATYVYSYDDASRRHVRDGRRGDVHLHLRQRQRADRRERERHAVESYSYDLNGNRTGTGYSTGTENEQTASPGYTYTYDNAGNLIAETNTSTACDHDVYL